MTRKRIGIAGTSLIALGVMALMGSPAQAWQMERLDRGVVAVPAKDGGILVSWRLLGTDTSTTAFNLYRNGTRLNPQPLTGATNYVDAGGSASATYVIKAIVGGVEQDRPFTATVWAQGFGVIPLDKPAGGTITNSDGSTSSYTYSANDASVADLDGDGKYEIVLKWDPSNAKDNSQSGITGPVLLDAYTLAGKKLWRINLGRNIRAGAHYTQFQVYDFDGDGRAEIVCRTADGTTDGQGRVIGDANADWRNSAGYVLAGPEFLTVFQGTTGKALSTVKYVVGRHPDTENPTSAQLNAVWGDGYGNRVDRFLAATAYLDGDRPSIIMARGYYTRTTLTAWDFRNGQLTQRWLFDTASSPSLADYAGQGNHNLSVADVDGDGKDEILYGSMALDDNGQPLWAGHAPGGQKLGHGDAMHVGDLDPSRPGLEKFGVHEDVKGNGGIGAAMLDARTGALLWSAPDTSDNGRGVSADIDPTYPGDENWSAHTALRTATGQVISATKKPNSTNFAIYWDGDTLRELEDNVSISKWNWNTQSTDLLMTAADSISANGTKATPALQADILGDWREELILASADSTKLRIFATPYPTVYKLKTLMHDRVYREGVAWQNTAYNQPPHTSFYLPNEVQTDPAAAPQ
ncbi:rhamnogalacturonan lyase [Sphingomonas sp. AP4-R1]|uniref:rhamnogalacturonan lyase n=1 Tax=Sphingomonas sp. AP4-R1 TaxID=2735134 RepID=UPI0014937010|nr:rhamnogalacturonan lyase [Sphingomonas sp. AP4-R1]QJU59972.1 rhamnogalacturonan lyase [Sphingomonas sp. AP4-R1]